MIGRFRILPRRVGRDVRTWPTLVLLLLVVLVAVGCVLWFMREAMRNEEMAVREKLTEAYRGQLSLLGIRVIEDWSHWRVQLDGPETGALEFARCIRYRFADSVVCLDEQGGVAYPRAPRPPDAEGAKAGTQLRDELRRLIQEKKTDEAVQFVLQKFGDNKAVLDEQGRLSAANAELLALETLGSKTDPRFQKITARLRARITDYATDVLPSSQRRFLMTELQRLDPESEFPTLAAEDLAAQFLETRPDLKSRSTPTSTELRGVWSVSSYSGRVLALVTTETMRWRLSESFRDAFLITGVRVTALAPGEEASIDPAPIVITLGPELPGWRLAMSLDDPKLFDTETAKRLKVHVIVACSVIAALTVLSLLLARSFGRQVALARLKNDLVATVSHELKTPLTAMRALVETLLDSEKLDEKTAREYLQLLATENTRLSRLIENFLTFSRLERNKFHFDFAAVHPSRVAEEAVAAFGERAHQPRCSFETKIASDLPEIRADADALTTALLNLLDNAWKYSGEEKRIILRADRHSGGVRFGVEDNGLGLSAREQAQVFERFYQADQRLARTVGGCGLGLSIVRSIVTAHGGRVDVASKPGQGSTFTIDLPAIPA